MNTVMRAAFADELNKIAGLRTGIADAVSAGWHGTKDNPQRWMGEGLKVTPSMGRLGKAYEYASSLGGATKYLPVGAKSLAVAGTALMLPHILKKEDQTGQGRSRLERLSGFAGNTLGGLAATGVLARSGIKSPFGMMAAGIVGGLAGEQLSTTPWALKRKVTHRLQRELPRQQDEGWRNVSPGGLTTTPDARSGQAQVM